MPESQFMKAFKVANFTIVEQSLEGAHQNLDALGFRGLETRVSYMSGVRFKLKPPCVEICV